MEDIVLPYLEGRKVELVKLAAAAQEQNWALLQQVGHKLSGSAGSYGFSELSVIGCEIERGAQEQNHKVLTSALSRYRLYLHLLRVEYVPNRAA